MERFQKTNEEENGEIVDNGPPGTMSIYTA
jgi:hypothetical protein